VKITDFGIAQSATRAGPQTGMVRARHYIAPEQEMGQDETPSSDVYAWEWLVTRRVRVKRAFTGEARLDRGDEEHQGAAARRLPSDLREPNVTGAIAITLVKNNGMRLSQLAGPFADAVARRRRRPPPARPKTKREAGGARATRRPFHPAPNTGRGPLQHPRPVAVFLATRPNTGRVSPPRLRADLSTVSGH